MTSKKFTFGKLVIRFNWAVAIFIATVFFILVRLGIWQLDRAQEKIQLQNNFQEMGENSALLLDEVAMSGLEIDALTIQNLHVTLSGEFLNDKNLFLIYQTYKENLGYEIVTPFKLDSSEKIVFVSRGWALANHYEELQQKIKPVTGKLTLEGQIYVPTIKQAARTNDIDLSNVQWPLEIRYINTIELAHLFEDSLFPYEIRLMENQPGVLVRHWPTVFVDTGRNFSYALQWFSMAIALLIVTFILSSNILHIIQQRSRPQ